MAERDAMAESVSVPEPRSVSVSEPVSYAEADFGARYRRVKDGV